MNAIEAARLKPANENPWYCLATLYGEQSGEDMRLDLLKRNRDGWDHWRSGRYETISERFTARMVTATASLPDRMQRIDFTFTHFEAPFIFRRLKSSSRLRTSVRLRSRTTLTSQGPRSETSHSDQRHSPKKSHLHPC